MNITKRHKVLLAGSVAIAFFLVTILFFSLRKDSKVKMSEIKPSRGDISMIVSTVGTVQPQNRLEIKPPVSGRIEKILVEEGQEVKVGEVIAFMSSKERATLVDAARLKGEQEFNYWQEAYKETPLVAPINGVVIVRDVEPGQTVGTDSVILVLSDRLIVDADVDETDIAGVKLGQKAVIGLDAYPEIQIDAVVDHISYESDVVNNVTIYGVDILPEVVPDVFRSGMSANVKILVKEERDVMLLPSEAIMNDGSGSFVYVKDAEGAQVKRDVKAGLQNDGYTEIVSGLSYEEKVLAPVSDYILQPNKNGSNPFLPAFGKRKNEKSK